MSSNTRAIQFFVFFSRYWKTGRTVEIHGIFEVLEVNVKTPEGDGTFPMQRCKCMERTSVNGLSPYVKSENRRAGVAGKFWKKTNTPVASL